MALDEVGWMPWAVSAICCRVLYGKYVGWISISDGELKSGGQTENRSNKSEGDES